MPDSIPFNPAALPYKNRDFSGKAFYHSDLKNSLEGIVINAKADAKPGLLGRLFSDKTKNLKATVKSLLAEIELREKLNRHILKKIDEDACKQNTNLYRLKNLKVQYSFELWENVNQSKIKIEDQLLELEKEKRKEYLECWRDLMFLKKYLMSALREYWDLVRRRDVLSSDKEI